SAISAAGNYQIEVPSTGGRPARVVSSGSVQIEDDRAPQATLDGGDRNRFVSPGERLDLVAGASDDFGIAGLAVRVRESSAADAAGAQALDAFQKAKDGATVATLKPLVDGPMTSLRADCAALADDAKLEARLAAITAQQDDIIARLIALLGSIADRERARLAA